MVLPLPAGAQWDPIGRIIMPPVLLGGTGGKPELWGGPIDEDTAVIIVVAPPPKEEGICGGTPLCDG